MLQINVKTVQNYTISGNTEVKTITYDDIENNIASKNAYLLIGKFSPEFLQYIMSSKCKDLNEMIAEQIKQDIINFLNKGEIKYE